MNLCDLDLGWQFSISDCGCHPSLRDAPGFLCPLAAECFCCMLQEEGFFSQNFFAVLLEDEESLSNDSKQNLINPFMSEALNKGLTLF